MRQILLISFLYSVAAYGQTMNIMTPPYKAPDTTTTTVTAQYLFENNLNDNVNSYDAVGVDIQYTGSVIKEGLYALQVNSTGDTVKISGLPSYTSISVAAWVYPTTGTANNQELFFNVPASGTGLLFELDMLGDGDIDFYANGSLIADDANILTLNAYNHIVFTYDKSTGEGTFYVDGVSVYNDQGGDTGASLDGTVYLMTSVYGYCDDVQIYLDKVLTASDASYLYNNIGSTIEE